MRRARHLTIGLTIAFLMCGLTACTTVQKGAGIGAAVGGGAGALIGHNSNVGSGQGALIGAAVGALGGALAGDVLAEKHERDARDYPPPY